MFASKSLSAHLIRGLLGLSALVLASLYAADHPWVSLVGVALGLVALRGCPMCWTIGLIQTVVAKLRGREGEPYCVDGSCAISTTPKRRSS